MPSAKQYLELITKGDASGLTAISVGLDGVETSSKKAETGMSKAHAAASLLGAATAGGVVAGIGASIKVSADFEKSLNGVQAAIYDTSKSAADNEAAFASLRKEALGIGKDTSKSASQAVEAMGELVKAGVSAADVVGGVGRTTVQLAEATGATVENMAALMSNTMNTFGISAKDMDATANILAKSANASAIGIDDMALSLSAVGPVAKMAGLSATDFATAIGIMGNQGLKGSDAGTSLKTMLLALTAPTDKARAMMEEYGIAMYDANGVARPFRTVLGDLQTAFGAMSDEGKATFSKDVFGTDAIRASNILVGQGVEGWDAFGKTMDAQASIAQQSALRLKGVSGQMEKLSGSVETAEINLGTVFLPTVLKVATAATQFTDKLIAFQDALAAGDPKAQALLKTLELVGGALTALFIVDKLIGPVTSLVNTVSTLYKLGSKTISIGIDLAETAYLHFLEFQDKLGALKDKTVKIAAEGQDKANSVLDTIKEKLEALKDKTVKVTVDDESKGDKSKLQQGEQAGSSAAKSAASGVAGGIGSALVTLAPKLSSLGLPGLIAAAILGAVAAGVLIFLNRDKIGKALEPIIGGISDFFTETVPAAFDSASGAVADFFTETIPQSAAKVPGILADAFRDAGSWVLSALEPIGGGIRDFWTETVPAFFTNTIPDAISQIPGILKAALVGTAFLIGAALAIALVAIPVEFFKAARKAGELFLDGLGWLADNLGPELAKIPGMLGDLAGPIADAVGRAFGAAWDWITGPDGPQSWPGKIWDFLLAIASKAGDLGDELVHAVAGAFGAAWDWVISEDGPQSWPGKAWDLFLRIADKLVELDVELVRAVTHAFSAAWDWVLSPDGPASWPGKAWDLFTGMSVKLWALDVELGKSITHAFGVAWDWVLSPDGPASWPGKAWDLFTGVSKKLWELDQELAKAVTHAFGTAWDWMIGPDGPKSWPDKVLAFFSELPGKMGRIGEALVSALGNPFSKLAGLFEGPINLAIDVLNGFAGGVNSILKKLDIGIEIPAINHVGGNHGQGGGPSALPEQLVGFAAGGVIDTPTTARIGEDAPLYPEYMIPSNPKYRDRARLLLAQASKALAGAGVHKPLAIGGPLDFVGDAFDSAFGTVKDWIDKGAEWLINEVISKVGIGLPSGASMGGRLAIGGFNLVKNGVLGLVKGGLSKAEADGRVMRRPLGAYQVTQEFGENPQVYGPGGHTGIDLAIGTGAPIMAAATGNTSYAGWLDPRGSGGYGNAAILDHLSGLQTLYGHMSQLLTATGKGAIGGSTIGLVGSTGFSTGPHLHFEVRSGGSPQNPRQFVSFATGGINSKHALLVDPNTGQMVGQISEGNKPEAIVPLTGGGASGGTGAIGTLNVTAQTVNVNGGGGSSGSGSSSGSGAGSSSSGAAHGSSSGSITTGSAPELPKADQEYDVDGIPGLNKYSLTENGFTTVTWTYQGHTFAMAGGSANTPAWQVLGFGSAAAYQQYAKSFAPGTTSSGAASGSSSFGTPMSGLSSILPPSAGPATPAVGLIPAGSYSVAPPLSTAQQQQINAYQRLIDANQTEINQINETIATLHGMISAGGPVADYAQGLLDAANARRSALMNAATDAQAASAAIQQNPQGAIDLTNTANNTGATVTAVESMSADARQAWDALQGLIDANNQELGQLTTSIAGFNRMAATGGPLSEWAADMGRQQLERYNALVEANRQAAEAQQQAANGNVQAANAALTAASTNQSAADTNLASSTDLAQVAETQNQTATTDAESADQIAASSTDLAQAADQQTINTDQDTDNTATQTENTDQGDEDTGQFTDAVDAFGNSVGDMSDGTSAGDAAIMLADERDKWKREHPGEPVPFAGGTMLTRPTLLMDATSGELIGLAAESGPEHLVNQNTMRGLMNRGRGGNDAGGGRWVDRSVTHNWLVPDPNVMRRTQRENFYTQRLTQANTRGS